MRWFEGDIAQAVGQSRARNAVFVVFVEGNNEASQRIASAINNDQVSSKLEGENFVAIHFESGTQTFNQFAQIYRNPPVPSLYFIGRNGAPIEIVTQVTDSQSLLEKVAEIENIHLGKSNQATPAPASTKVASPQASSQASQPQASSSTPSAVSGEESDTTGTSSSAAGLDQRVEHAKELLEEKRMKKRIEEEEAERQKEIQRRKEGQNVQELRRWQQEQELKQLKEERLKEKRMEQEARQRVLEQIAQDKANRNAKNAQASSSSPSSQPMTATTPAPSNSNEAHLQFRLPDGSTHSHRFNADATLADVRQYILSNLTLPYQDFALATVFPRREFSSQDNAFSLRDLQLVPSSVMLIVPAGAGSAVQQSSGGLFGFVETIWLFMTYPITRIFSFLRTILFAAPPAANNGGPSSGSTSGSTTSSQSQAHAQQEKRPQRRSGGAYRRAGNSNVHRLHQNNSSSDDENNTWNGNSTQQM